MEMSKELQKLFLIGGTVVYRDTAYYHNYDDVVCIRDHTSIYLIRMPKGKFITDWREEKKDNFFEYVRAEDYRKEGFFQVTHYMNGTFTQVKNQIKTI